MSYRDDHAAAIARIDSLQREQRQLAAETERLTGELASAREWLGGPRKRIVLLVTGIASAIVLVLGGWMVGSNGGEKTVYPIFVKPPERPDIHGVLVASGSIGHWVLVATRCVPRDDGVELTALGTEDHNIWLGEHLVELELPDRTITLDGKKCVPRFDHGVVRRDDKPASYDGHVQLDCHWDDNRLHGRIDFARCR